MGLDKAVSGFVSGVTGAIGGALSAIGGAVSGVVNAIGNAVQSVGNTISNIMKDPLPTLLQVGGAMVGIPPYVTAAVITAAKGGSLEDMAKSAAVSYASTTFMSSTQIGADIQNYTTNAWAGDFTDSMMDKFDLSPDQAVQISKVASASLNSSLIGGINAALTGKDIGKGISSGFTSGLVYSSTDSFFDSVNKDPNWGFSDKALNLMKGATSTALNTIISGKGDPSQALGNYIAYATMNMGATSLAQNAKDAYKLLTTDTDAAKASQDNYTTAKAELDTKAKTAEELRTSINADSEAYQKTIDEKYTPFKTQYDKLSADNQAANDTFNQQKKIFDDNKWAYDNYDAKMRQDGYALTATEDGSEYMKPVYGETIHYPAGWGEDGWNDAYDYRPVIRWDTPPTKQSYADAANAAATAANAAAATSKSTGDAAKKLVDDNQAMLDSIESTGTSIQKKVGDFNAIKAEIGTPSGSLHDSTSYIDKFNHELFGTPIPKVDDRNLAQKLVDASNDYQTKYDAWAKTKDAADRSAENYTKALAEVATRDATIDAVNSGAIKVTGKDADGNWTLSNGMTLTTQGKFVQDGQQVFTNAAGIPQKMVDAIGETGAKIYFGENAGQTLSVPEVKNICTRDYGFTPTDAEAQQLANTVKNDSSDPIVALADQRAKDAYSSITGKQPTDAELADVRKSGNVITAAQDAAINGLDLPADYKFPDQDTKVKFTTALAAARSAYGDDAKFQWTNPKTGVTGTYSTRTEAQAEKPFDASSMQRSNLGDAAQAALNAGKTTFTWFDGKTYKVPDAYAFLIGPNQSSAETNRLLSAGVVPAKSTDKANDYFGNNFVTDPMTGAIVSGDGWAAGTSGKTFDSMNTAVGGALINALDIGSGIVKGGANIVGQIGTLGGLTGLVNMDNVLTISAKQVGNAVDQMRSTDFKDNQDLMNKAIAKAGNAGFFEQAVETAKQFGVNPVQLAEFVVENGMSLLVGSGAVSVARALGAGMTIAEAASIGANALTQGASVAQDTYDQAIKDKVPPEEALARARAAGSIGGIVSAVANKYIPGALSAEVRLAEAAAIKDTLAVALRGEISAEIIEEASGKIASNIANNKPWNEDLGTTVVQAVLGSGIVTGLVHASTGANDPIASTPQTGLEGITAQEFKNATDIAASSGRTPTVDDVTNLVKSADFYNQTFGVDATPEQLKDFVGKPLDQVQQIITLDHNNIVAQTAGFPDFAVYTQYAGDLPTYQINNAISGVTLPGGMTTNDFVNQVKAAAAANPTVNAVDIANTVAARIKTNPSTTAADLSSQINSSTQYLALKQDIQNAIANIKLPAGLSSADVTNAISTYMKANPGLSITDVAAKITDATKGLVTDAGLQTALSTALKGVATQQDIKDAIANIKFPAGLSKADVAAEISAAMAANPGLNAADVTKSITDYMTAHPGLSAADVNTAITNATKGLATATSVTDLDAKLSAAIADARAAGLTGNEALQKAIDTVAANQKTSSASLLATMGTTAADLKTQFASDLAGVKTGLTASIADLNTKLSAAIESAKSAGMTGDAALQAAIDSVAATQKTSSADLLAKLGTTTADLKAQFSSDLAGVQTTLQTDIAKTRTDLETAIKAATDSGLKGDAALQAAIDSVAATQKTSSTELLNKLGATAADLKTQFSADLAGVQAGLQGSIDKLSGTVKTQYDSLTQAQKDAVAAQVQQGKDLTKAISDTASGLQTQITGLSTDLQTKYDALTQAQKDAIALQVQQGKDLTKAISDAASGLQGQITGLSQDSQAKYNALSDQQKALVTQLTQQGTDFNTALAQAQAQTQTQIAGLSADTQAKFNALTDQQKALATQLAQQGIDFNSAINQAQAQTQTQISGLSADMQAKYNTLTAAQKATVDQLTKQGTDFNTALAQAQTQTQTQITNLSADMQTKYDALTAAQKATVDQLTKQGTDFNTALANAQAQTQTQITGLSADMQAKYDTLTQAQKNAVDSQVQMGKDLRTAIDTAAQTNANQITQTKVDLTKNITDVQTQFNSRVDQLMKQGQDYQTATNTALKELGTGVTGLQTSVTDIQKQQAADAAARKAAAQTSKNSGLMSQAMSILAPAAAAGAAGLIDDSIPGYKDIGLKTSGDAKFESVLSPFEKMVQSDSYAGKQQQAEQPTQQQLQQAAPVNQDLNQQQDQQQGSDYFNYGTQSEIDQMLGSNPGTQMLYSKKGGLATPLFAGGGTTRHGRYAGGGLPIVEHSGKARIDFRTGNAVTGPGDGQSDDIPAMLADGEFVFPADVVAALGNGSTKAGSDKLYDMMHSIRAYHRSAKPEDLPPPAKKSPLDYLKKTKARK